MGSAPQPPRSWAGRGPRRYPCLLMEPSGSRAIRKPAWQPATRLLGLALVLIGGTWLVAETERPWKVEARQIRADHVTYYELQAAGRFLEADDAWRDQSVKWERYAEYLRQENARMTAISHLGSANEGLAVALRQAAADSLSTLPADWPSTRRLVLPAALAGVGLALLIVSLRARV